MSSKTEELEMEIIYFDEEDVIVTSGEGDWGQDF
jgi:hypothetical protein